MLYFHNVDHTTYSLDKRSGLLEVVRVSYFTLLYFTLNHQHQPNPPVANSFDCPSQALLYPAKVLGMTAHATKKEKPPLKFSFCSSKFQIPNRLTFKAFFFLS